MLESAAKFRLICRECGHLQCVSFKKDVKTTKCSNCKKVFKIEGLVDVILKINSFLKLLQKHDSVGVFYYFQTEIEMDFDFCVNNDGKEYDFFINVIKKFYGECEIKSIFPRLGIIAFKITCYKTNRKILLIEDNIINVKDYLMFKDVEYVYRFNNIIENYQLYSLLQLDSIKLPYTPIVNLIQAAREYSSIVKRIMGKESCIVQMIT